VPGNTHSYVCIVLPCRRDRNIRSVAVRDGRGFAVSGIASCAFGLNLGHLRTRLAYARDSQAYG